MILGASMVQQDALHNLHLRIEDITPIMTHLTVTWAMEETMEGIMVDNKASGRREIYLTDKEMDHRGRNLTLILN